MEYWFTQIQNKDVGKRLQVGPDLIEYLSDRQKCVDLEQDQTLLDKMVDALATSWVNSSNYKVGADLLFHHLLCTTKAAGGISYVCRCEEMVTKLIKECLCRGISDHRFSSLVAFPGQQEQICKLGG